MANPISEKQAKIIYDAWISLMYGVPIPAKAYKPKTVHDKKLLCEKRVNDVIANSKFAPI